MSSESTEIKDIDEIARQADSGADVSEHFTGHYTVFVNQSIIIGLTLSGASSCGQ